MATWVVEEPKWPWTLQQYLSRFQDQGILCDTILACANGKTIRAHSCVLAAASDRIRNLLNGVQSNGYTLRMDSVTSTTWHYLIRFIYDGRVSLPLNQVERVKDAAVRFQILPLIKLLNTVDRLRAEISEKTSCAADKGDVIVLDEDDENDDDDDVVMVEGGSNLAGSVTLPAATDREVDVAVSDGDAIECRSSSLVQSSLLPEPTEFNATSASVPCLATTASLLDDTCVDVSLESPRMETHESGTNDNALSDITRRNTNTVAMGLHALEKSYDSSQFSSEVPSTSPCPVSRANRFSPTEADEIFDVSEVVSMDMPSSSCTQADGRATEKVSEVRSSSVPGNYCSPTSSQNTPSFFQAASPDPDLFRQFIVSRPSEISLPVVVDKKEGTDTKGGWILKSVSNDSVPVPVGESRLSEDEFGRVDNPQNGPLEERTEEEAPLLCISNVVSLSGQTMDFSEPDSAFITKNHNSNAEVEVAFDDATTGSPCVEDNFIAASPRSFVSSHSRGRTQVLVPRSVGVPAVSRPRLRETFSETSILPFPDVSVSRPYVVKSSIVNSTGATKDTTEMTQVSNYAATKALSATITSDGLCINLSSARLAGDESGLLSRSNLHIPIQPRSASAQSAGARPGYHFLLFRPPNTAVRGSNFPSSQCSRHSKMPLRNKSFSNIRLVASDSRHRFPSPQSFVPPRSGGRGRKQVLVPRADGVPAVPHSRFMEPFPEASVLPFPDVPILGSEEEFPMPAVIPFPTDSFSDRVEEFPHAVPFGAVSHNHGPVGELSSSDRMEEEETFSDPTGCSLPSEMDHSYTYLVESTTKKRKKYSKPNVGLKPEPKRRKSATLTETVESSFTKPSDDTSEFMWPGESTQFNGCTQLTTVHYIPVNSQTPQSSMATKVKRVRKPRKSAETVVDPIGKLDSQAARKSSADEVRFVQPDSTVLETRPVSLVSSVYNFTESDSESSVLPERPQSSVKSPGRTETVEGGANVVKRRGRKPGLKLDKKPAQKKTSPQELLQDGEKPKRRRRRTKKELIAEKSGGSASTEDPPSSVKFVGREIRHEWVVGTEPRATRWYTGRVLSVTAGEDGERSSQYEVKYDDEDAPYLVDHLFEDYLDGSLRFV